MALPVVKNPLIRARLIRCAQGVQILEAARKLAGDDLMIIPADEEEENEEDEAEDIEAIAPLIGLGLRTLAPAAMSGLMSGIGGALGGGGAGGEPKDMQAAAEEGDEGDDNRDTETEDPEEKFLEKILQDSQGDGRLANILTEIGRTTAPRAIENVDDDMVGSSWDEEDKEDGAGMDDGSYPAGPRTEKNKSRYKVEPGSGQSATDLMRTTAGSQGIDGLINRLTKVADGR